MGEKAQFSERRDSLAACRMPFSDIEAPSSLSDRRNCMSIFAGMYRSGSDPIGNRCGRADERPPCEALFRRISSDRPMQSSAIYEQEKIRCKAPKAGLDRMLSQIYNNILL